MQYLEAEIYTIKVIAQYVTISVNFELRNDDRYF